MANQADSDIVLMEKLRSGDQLALKSIFNSYFNYLCTTAYKYIGDEHLAKDLTQDVFFELWRRREDLQIKMSLKFYLRRAVINKSLNHIKSQRIQFEDTEEAAMIPSGQSSMHKELEAQDLDSIIHKTIEALPERCRIIFSLSRQDGLSHKEIANQLEISTKTIENQISKALKILKNAIQPYLEKGLILLLCLLEIGTKFGG